MKMLVAWLYLERRNSDFHHIFYVYFRTKVVTFPGKKKWVMGNSTHDSDYNSPCNSLNSDFFKTIGLVRQLAVAYIYLLMQVLILHWGGC